MKKSLILIVLLLASLLVLQGCARRGSGESVEVKGSDTMVNLGQAWAEAYAEENPDAEISITGGGSGTGIAALINGDTDIAQASREMKQEEIDQAKQKGMDPKQFVVAQDGLSVVANPSNSVGRLTVDQLSGIYTGKITNWREVGGKDQAIVVLSREKNSGTHIFFLEQVVRKGNVSGSEEFGRSVLMLPSSQAIADEVATNSAAIGYMGMGYVDEARHKPVSVAQDANSPYVEPTEENVLNGSYPIARDLYFYTPNEPEGTVKSFIDFALSDEGQRIVEQQEFVRVGRD